MKENPCPRCEMNWEDHIIIDGVVQGKLCKLCDMEVTAQANGMVLD